MRIPFFSSASTVTKAPYRRVLPELILCVLAAQSMHAVAGEVAVSAMAPVQFDGEFLVAGGSGQLDLSRFERGNVVLPGSYRVDIHVNQNYVLGAELPFRNVSDVDNATACLDTALLERLGVDIARLDEQVHVALASAPGQCLPIEQLVEGASAHFDFSNQRLELSVPQIFLLHRARGYVDPSQLDSGINAAMLSYNLNVYRNQPDRGEARTFGYMGINAGVNLGRWRIRHDGSYRYDNQGQRDYQAIASYAKRDIPTLSAELTVGDAYTSGELFDSTAFRGVRLQSDDRMLPDSLRGFAPVVRGVANSNAKVSIRQNGALLLETTVAPGAFQIDDLYATGYGGDLEVTVQEADGSSHVFAVPFAAVPLSLRPGRARFSAVVGTLRDGNLHDEPLFAQGTWQQGVSNRITGYGGFTVAQDYLSGMAGVALNTGWGAFGADVTQSYTDVPGLDEQRGTSYRFSYARDIRATGTHVSIAAYRYSTEQFHGLNQAMRLRDSQRTQHDYMAPLRQRNRASLNIGQDLGQRAGRLYLTASLADYWKQTGSDVDYSLGYSGAFGRLSYSLSAQRQHGREGRADTQYFASFNMPLGGRRPQSFSSNLGHQSNGRNQVQASLSGTGGAHHNLSYSVSGSHTDGGGASGESSASGNLFYRASKAELSASASVASSYTQTAVGARGALVIHGGGWMLSQPLSETFGIVQASDAHGARVLNSAGVRVGRNGFAVVPYLTPYRMNGVELDPKGLSTDVELKVSRLQVAPRAGAVALVRFATESGRSAVLEVAADEHGVLPFGADVFDEELRPVGVVGQAGRIFVRGLKDSGSLTVKWNADTGADALCQLDYVLPARAGKTDSGLQTVNVRCERL